MSERPWEKHASLALGTSHSSDLDSKVLGVTAVNQPSPPIDLPLSNARLHQTKLCLTQTAAQTTDIGYRQAGIQTRGSGCISLSLM